MAFTLIGETYGFSSDGFADGVTATFDSSGADLLVFGVSDYAPATTGLVDNFGNTLVPLTARTSSLAKAQLYYVANPTVGAGHYCTISGSDYYGSVFFKAFSGAHASPFDQQNGATTGGAASLATGSITPTENNELVVALLCYVVADAVTINGGFSSPIQLPYGGVSLGGALSHLIQTSLAAANPTFSYTSSSDAAAAIASFKAAGGLISAQYLPPISQLGAGGGFIGHRHV